MINKLFFISKAFLDEFVEVCTFPSAYRIAIFYQLFGCPKANFASPKVR